MGTVVVVEYDKTWPALFEQIRSYVWPAVSDIALRVEHVGSTSVPGLAAKPIIDLDIVIAGEAEVPAAVERLGRLGYVHQGNLGIEGREAFQQPPDLPAHHLYVCAAGGVALANHLAVRDYLRAHHEAAERYGELKQRLASEFPNDMSRYMESKTDFILDILRHSGLSSEQLAAVERVNRRSKP